MVAKNNGLGSIVDLSRNGKFAVLSRLVNRGDNNLYLVNLSDGKETLLTAHQGPGQFSGISLSPDGRTLYLISNKDRDLTAFARVRLDEKDQPGPIEVLAARNDGELANGVMNEQGTMVALVWNIAGRMSSAFTTLLPGKQQPAQNCPRSLLPRTSSRKMAGDLLLTLSGSSSPNDIWILDMSSKQFTQLTHSPHAGIDLTKLVRPELVTYKAHDGLELSGWLYRPRDTRTWSNRVEFPRWT